MAEPTLTAIIDCAAAKLGLSFKLKSKQREAVDKFVQGSDVFVEQGLVHVRRRRGVQIPSTLKRSFSTNLTALLHFSCTIIH